MRAQFLSVTAQLLILSSYLVGLVSVAEAKSVVSARQLLEKWQLEDALAMAQELFLENPNNPQIWLLAAEVQHHRGEHISALALLEAAEQAQVEPDPSLRARLQTAVRYQNHFAKLDSSHFSFRYLDKDEIVATLAGPILEAAYANLKQDFSYAPAELSEKIVVEIYPNVVALSGVSGLSVKDIITSGTIAVCKFHRIMMISPLGTLGGYDWASTLTHEFVHLSVAKKSGDKVHVWLHEGIAKYYESRWQNETNFVYDAYGEKLLATALKKNSLIPLKKLHPSMAKLPTEEDVALAFAQVFTLVEYLQARFGPGAIARLLDQLGQEISFEAALSQVFGMTFSSLEKSWRKALLKRKFKDVPGAAPRQITFTTDENQARSEILADTIADQTTHGFARLGELLELEGQVAAAVIEYEKAYKRSGFRLAGLLNRLARAYVKTGRLKEAQALLKRLIEAHPQNSDARLLAGRMFLVEKNFTAAKAEFEAIALKNPFNPEIHAALAQIYLAQGDTQKAQRAQKFYELSTKPRPQTIYESPRPASGNAKISILTSKWEPVRINGQILVATPNWNMPVDAGEISLEVVTPKGLKQRQTFQLGVGETKLVVLR